MALTVLDFEIYGYTPTLYVCAIFVALFSASAILHVIQAFIYKRKLWWMVVTAGLCGLGELMGWAARLWSAKNVYILEAYLMQTVLTIISPTFLLAANFVILGILIKAIGPEYSRLRPMMYSIIFIIADLIALTIQAVGGAQAAQAVRNDGNADIGGNIMLGGICFQMAAIVIYVAFMSEFVIRCWLDKPLAGRVVLEATTATTTKESATSTKEESSGENLPHKPVDGSRALHRRNIQLMLFALLASTVFIFARSVYRTIELTDGWTGDIIANETLFNVCDGAMILLALVALNVFHPAKLLEDELAPAPKEVVAA